MFVVVRWEPSHSLFPTTKISTALPALKVFIYKYLNVIFVFIYLIEDKVATKCVKCHNVLTSGGVTFRGEPWHKVSQTTTSQQSEMFLISPQECFVCARCETALAGQKFASREEKPFCAECFAELFAKRCASCSKPITGQGGTR